MKWIKQNTKCRPFCSDHGILTRYVKLRVAHAPGTFSPPLRVSDPDMHHGTCVTHVPRCMPGSLTSGFVWSRCRESVPSIPGACATRSFAYLARGPLLFLMLCQSALTYNLPTIKYHCRVIPTVLRYLQSKKYIQPYIWMMVRYDSATVMSGTLK